MLEKCDETFTYSRGVYSFFHECSMFNFKIKVWGKKFYFYYEIYTALANLLCLAPMSYLLTSGQTLNLYIGAALLKTA